jgi:glycosyltransferase involved in cell wall biosynthesis
VNMRLLFVCPDMRTGGAERQWATLIPALRERGADARVLCLADEGGLYGEIAAAGVPATCLHMRGRGDVRGLRRALRFAEPRPDAVVSRGVSAQIVGQAIARRGRSTHVLNEHTPLTPAGDLLPARPHQRLLLRLVAPRVGRVIAVCDPQIEPLVRLGYRRERIDVVPNGIFEDGPRPAAGREATRAELGLADGDFAALCVARLEPEKRVDVFLRSVAAAGERLPALRAFVAGSGRELERLRPLASAAKAELLGSRADVPDLMIAADAVCLTSDAEALPMSVLEAMALGRPVVATKVGGTSQAIGEAGVLVAPGDPAAVADALVALAADPARAEAFGTAARERQRELFSGNRMVDGYMRVLGAL